MLGNIHRHNTTIVEATVKFMRGYLVRRTQNRGNSGNGDTRTKYFTSNAVQKLMLRMAGRTIGEMKRSPGGSKGDFVHQLTEKGQMKRRAAAAAARKKIRVGSPRKRGRPRKGESTDEVLNDESEVERNLNDSFMKISSNVHPGSFSEHISPDIGTFAEVRFTSFQLYLFTKFPR